jgi:transposase InsO family protein
MREHDLLAPGRVGKPRGPRNHDGTIISDAVDTMWRTDMTTTWTAEGQVAVFISVDHNNAECVGIHAARRHFGAIGKGVARGLAVRHDHGSLYMSDALQTEMRFLGIESSPAFVRAPEGNGCAERFIRTLKENLLWIRTSIPSRISVWRSPRHLQRHLAHPAPRLSHARTSQTRPAFNSRSRRVASSQMSHQPRAVHPRNRFRAGQRGCMPVPATRSCMVFAEMADLDQC